MPGSDDGIDNDAPASLAAQYWHHHFRRLFHKQVLLLLLPTLCDLVGAALLNIGEATPLFGGLVISHCYPSQLWV
jgi:hypothetical protein